MSLSSERALLMQEARHAKQIETNHTKTIAPQQPTRMKPPLQQAVNSTHLPLYAQAWGDCPPPWLRLSPLPQNQSEQPVQRQVAEEVEPLQGKQHVPASIEERPSLQRKEMLQVPPWGNDVPPWLRLPVPTQAQQEQKSTPEPVEPLQCKENTTGLPDTLKAGVESLSGVSLNAVHVHYHSPKPTEVGALAYTQDSEIYVGSGQEQHLPHEAWHVVQQKQGRVQPTVQVKGAIINDDQKLEREADSMGDKAFQKVAHFTMKDHSSLIVNRTEWGAPAKRIIQAMRDKNDPDTDDESVELAKTPISEEEVNTDLDNWFLKTFPDIETGKYGLDKSYLRDLRRVKLLMRDEGQLAVELLAPLEEKLAKWVTSGGKLPPHTLTNVLREKEIEHGFSDARLLPLGILPPELFLYLNRLGYMIKDVGAGYPHGEYTHRLQWYLIMEQFERDVRATVSWDHTPFELFTRIGQRDFNIRTSEGGHAIEMFASLMDLMGGGPGLLFPNFMTKFFVSDAEKVTARQEVEESRKEVEPPKDDSQAKLPTLSTAVADRYKKRKNAREVAKQEVELETSRFVELPTSPPERIIKDIARIRADETYASQKLTSNKYETYDPLQQGAKIVIYKGDRQMTDDQVIVQQALSRVHFNLPLSEEQGKIIEDIKKHSCLD